MKLTKISEAKLPTSFGEFLMIVFEESKTDKNHIALVYGDIKDTNNSVLSRIHSECLTGDALFSIRCDCGFQLKSALMEIVKEGSGILIYHRQEGRNIGLSNKIRAYALQDIGLDTVEANHHLGFSADERDFSVCIDIFNTLNIKKIKLLTNNPSKVTVLNNAGIQITERISLIVGRNAKNSKYLNTKAHKMGHFLPIEY
ncbi:GTP cyclohydrolase II [Buchnera aphidicola str. Bp (Baizongia pistaciae)]|uniref:GTP cyclohydrolase-2 n=1 Tax=Buchnera aphidicola subsp. Baizongia pistaciae (strain Bp) TaxID=224915 RepID=RIBA_BUCBP|nr:GTP cyclohydrolase II [Buchnera aphidicola]P59555.1 RecName: Full=GTP cyclohydrolase-2; AltName: Full=GTP cyclohydrolase II [Buchnera aphidicola str. Bp (Baizongia pistaciae)]AAO26979.1 GTP cyclohydrolase II [Buchnera aphidicola str. Bp (Baizongia pistaciae)]